jgi:hypothetical protein
VVVITGIVVTIMVRVFDALDTLFVAVIVTLKLPEAVGVPEITPVEAFMLKAVGRPVAVNVGAGTPVAVTVVVYATPVLAVGRLVMVIAGADRTVRPKVAVSEPTVLVAFMLTTNVPSDVGVPEMRPAPLIVRPVGSPVAVKVGCG